MRVVVVHNLQAGGARRRLAAQLSELRAEVTEVCLASGRPVTAGAIVVPHSPVAPRAPRALRPPLRYSDLLVLERAWGRVARIAERLRADVLFANPCRFLQAPPALTRTRLPSVYFCDEPRRVDYEDAARATRNRRTRGVYGPLHRHERALDRDAVRHATLIATNSSYTATRIGEAYERAADILPMGVDAAFCPDPRVVPGRSLLSVGTLIPSKGHDLVIQAAALARHPVTVVAPRAQPREEARLHSCARELGVQLEIRVGISDEALVGAYREAYATVYMARAEPLGLVALEAQACGCPVIVADEGGLPETVAGRSAGWSVRRDPWAIAEALERAGGPLVRAAAAREGAASTWAGSAAALHGLLERACA
jgi:glycosyltransferase involved in cell wall biosynthesis